jgi:hypothetical protein
VASNALSHTLNLARSGLESFHSVLPLRIQALIPRLPPSPSPAPSAFTFFDFHNTAYLTVLAGSVILPLLLIVVSMSGWRSYLSGGRYSPFTTAPPTRPTVTEDDYHYLGPDDIVDPPRHDPYQASNYPRHGLRADAEDPRAPDIIILKHRGTTYPLHFPAFTIGEGQLRVGELRKNAARQTGAGDPARIKLLYKGKVLKDDAVACREEGLKQNSELMAVITDISHSEDESSEDSASEDEMAYVERIRGSDSGPRVDVDGTIIGGEPRRRKHRSKKSPRQDEGPASYHPQSSSSVPPPQPRTTAAAPPPRPAATPQPPKPMASSQPPPPQTGPKTAMQKLDDVMHVFHDKYAPMAEDYLANVPQDEKSKKQEYMKLSETILAQVIFKLDGVETEGDPDARAKRKALVQETQDMLNRLDAVGKEPVEEPVGRVKKGRRNR